jgi:hypothetical protein
MPVRFMLSALVAVEVVAVLTDRVLARGVRLPQVAVAVMLVNSSQIHQQLIPTLLVLEVLEVPLVQMMG